MGAHMKTPLEVVVATSQCKEVSDHCHHAAAALPARRGQAERTERHMPYSPGSLVQTRNTLGTS